MSNEHLVEIETKLSHLELTVQELNEVVTEQHLRIAQLEELCTALVGRLQSLSSGDSIEQPQDERPPHY